MSGEPAADVAVELAREIAVLCRRSGCNDGTALCALMNLMAPLLSVHEAAIDELIFETLREKIAGYRACPDFMIRFGHSAGHA